MRFDDGAREGQAEAAAPGVTGRGALAAPEPLEQVGQLLGRDADAAVGHGQLGEALLLTITQDVQEAAVAAGQCERPGIPGRLEDMELEGIDAEICFPSLGLWLYALDSAEAEASWGRGTSSGMTACQAGAVSA